MKKLTAQLEALLFLHGEALLIKKAARLLKVTEKEIAEAAEALTAELKRGERGLTLIKNEDTFQLTTKSDFASWAAKISLDEQREELTPAALETLTIIAYSSPISKAVIEYLRGVNSTFTLRNLLMRGLITDQSESPPEAKEANPTYRITVELLKHLGLTSIDQLPDYQKYRELKNLKI